MAVPLWCRLAGSLLVLALGAGCQGQASLDGFQIPVEGGEPTYDNPTVPPLGPDGSLSCDVASVPATVTLASIAADFARVVQPAMVRQTSECASCHAPTSGRPFVVGASGEETFYAARAAGLLGTGAGSLLWRLTSTDESLRMPRGQPAWSTQEVGAVASLLCQLAAVEARGPQTPPDEEFPPALLQAYSGPDVSTYDNSFLSAVQLQGKVKQVFNDDWVREGVDLFAANVGLFGGVDYKVHYVEARSATADFLMGLDKLAPDVCGAAARNRTGPFAGLDTSAPLHDVPPSVTRQYEVEKTVLETTVPLPEGTELVGTRGQVSGGTWGMYWSATVTTAQPYEFPAPGTWRFTVRARGDQCDGAPLLQLRIGDTLVKQWEVASTTLTEYTHDVPMQPGALTLSLGYPNDGGLSGVCDRNLYLDYFRVQGPLEPATGTARADAARAHVDTLLRRMLYRASSAQEQADGFALVKDLYALEPDLPAAWSGLCEGLMRSPDFLFTLPPSREKTSGVEKDRLLLVKLAQDLLGRPPTAAELASLESGQKTYAQLVDEYLASADFRAHYFHKMRVRTESEGTPLTDEPARLWTYLATQGAPLQQLLTGDYSVAEDFTQVARPEVHGRTGLLTMKGFIKNKPGLPHYNYAARVMTDFMGTLFEVPSEVFDQRGVATATSTVDPTSMCYSCHQNLTPLAHQRLRWDDEGNYRSTDAEGRAIDDSDRSLVAAYAFKGQGMEAFATQAARKEAFMRRTLNAQYLLFFNREMRHSADERVIYKRLWDVAHESNGNLKAVLRTIALSPEYMRP